MKRLTFLLEVSELLLVVAEACEKVVVKMGEDVQEIKGYEHTFESMIRHYQREAFRAEGAGLLIEKVAQLEVDIMKADIDKTRKE